MINPEKKEQYTEEQLEVQRKAKSEQREKDFQSGKLSVAEFAKEPTCWKDEKFPEEILKNEKTK